MFYNVRRNDGEVMAFDNFNEFHDYIRNSMTSLNTNIALINIGEKNGDGHIVSEPHIVTMDKKNGDLSFFSKCGIQMTWLSLTNILPSTVKSLIVGYVIDMAACDINVVG